MQRRNGYSIQLYCNPRLNLFYMANHCRVTTWCQGNIFMFKFRVGTFVQGTQFVPFKNI